MHRTLRWTLWGLSGLLALIAVLAIGLIVAANSPYGRHAIERAATNFSAGQVTLRGLDGDFPRELTIKHLALKDSNGIWITIDGLLLHWQPMQLLAFAVDVERLQAQRITLIRLPVATSEPETSGKWSIPLAVTLRTLKIEHLDMAQSIAGQASSFEVEGQLSLKTIQRGNLALHLQRSDSQDAYHIQAKLTDQNVSAHLSLHEAANGLVANLAGLRNQESLNLDASLEGPLSSASSHVALQLEPLQAQLDGSVDFIQSSADLKLSAHAPAMQLQQDLAWKTLALTMHLQGALNKLNVDGNLHLEGLNVAHTAVGSANVTLKGINGQLELNGSLTNLRLSPSTDDILQVNPLAFKAKLGLDQLDTPFSFELNHPLLAANGQGTVQNSHSQLDMVLNLPNLQPLAALGGLQMAGNGKLTLQFTDQDTNHHLKTAGKLSITGNDTLAKLLGESTQFDLSLDQQGKNITLPALNLKAKALNFSADGSLLSDKAKINWKTQLTDMSAIDSTLLGHLSAEGHMAGELRDLDLSAELKGTLTRKGYPGGPINANLQLHHLPNVPKGRMTVAGELLGAPINLQVTANRADNKTIQLGIEKAHWKSAHAQGGLMFTQESPFPTGRLELGISHLADFQPLLNQPLTGSVSGVLASSLQGDQPQTTLRLDAKDSGLEGFGTVKHSTLELSVNTPNGSPRLNGLVSLIGINAGALQGSAQLKLDGPLDALNLQLSANLPKLSDSDAQLTSAMLLDTKTRSLRVKTLQAKWHEQSLRLLSPTTIAFKDGLAIDRLRLGLLQAELDIDGRLSPGLALTAELHNTSANLLSLFAPDLAMNGTLNADAQLHGSLALPTGQVRVNGEKLQMQTGPARALPPAQFNANAILHGELADLNLKFTAGNDINLNVDGSLPLTHAGLFNLHSEAALNLKRLDPLLSADGRQLRGQLSMKAQVAGSWPSPILSGTAHVNDGEWQDFVSGIAVNQLTVAVNLENGILRIVQFSGHAGPGTINGSGSIGLLSTGMPIKLTFTARNARPLASDKLTVNLDADLVLSGLAATQMTATGRIRINRADIRIPERMPASIAVLKLSNAVTLHPQVPSVNSDIGLDVTLDAPRKIFIRGRRLDAELGGKIHISGNIAKPIPDGEFKLKRGQFSIAGQTLDFDQGLVGFESNQLTNPSLNFVANSTRNNITATLTVAGSAQQPTFTLSSTPSLPQDEIMANLLFGKGTASLSPLELVQIATTLASLTGLTSGIGDPLDDVRKKLSLDRLSVGGANPSLEAGRYIAPGVYLGASQGISGGTPQATIQIDITKGLKLQGGIGSGTASSPSGNAAATSNSIGAIYQFEY